VNTGRVVLGTAFVSLGSLFLLEEAGAVDAGAIISDWWPVVLLVVAALELLSRPPRPVSAGVWGLLGLVLLAVTTDVVDASVWTLVGPTAAIALGIWLLARRPGAGEAESPGDAVDVTAVFSGRRVVNASRSFRGGTATAVFGGVDLDLTGAHIDGTAVLDAVAVFGGVELLVPGTWQVRLDGPAIFGGHENRAPILTDPDAPVLRIRGTAIFGAVEVRAAAVPAPVEQPVG
jgi:hypothetical protein